MGSLSANEKSFIEMMGKSEEHARHGFHLLLKRNDFLKFFDLLVDRGLFAPDRNPVPVPAPDENAVRIPYWTGLDYLAACAKVAGDTSDLALAEKVMAIIRTVSSHSTHGGRDNYHTFRRFAEILGLLPTASITSEDLTQVKAWLNTRFNHDLVASALSEGAIPRFLASADPSDWQKAVQLVGYCTEIRWQPSRFPSDTEEPVAVVDEYWLKDLLDKHASVLGAKAGPEAASLFSERVREVFGRGGRAEWSHVFRPSVGGGQVHPGRTAENCVVEGLRDVLLAWCDVNDQAAGDFVDTIIRDTNEMLRRIGIYLVGERWDALKGRYLPIVRPQLFSVGHLHELYGLLRRHFDSFSDKEKAATIDAIQKLPTADGVEDTERLERLQLRWLSAISETKHAPAVALLNGLRSKHGEPPKRPDSLSHVEVRWGPGPSQYTAHELAALAESGTIVARLKAFKPGNDWDGPTTDALVDQLQAAVRTSPAVFLRVLPDFIAAPIEYQYAVVNGFLKVWREPDAQHPFPGWDAAWVALFDFFTALLDDSGFWKAVGSGRREVTPMWIASAIADMLQAGTRDDERAYPPALLSKGWSILITLLEHGEAVTEPSDDPMTQAINSTRGRAIEAVFSHILRRCRLADKESRSHERVWTQVVDLVDDELAKSIDANFEFSTLAGAYMANLEYIDRNWLTQNITRIFPIDQRANFMCAVAGLAFASASRSLYLLLRDAGVIDEALRLDLTGRDSREKLLERLVLGYLWGEDTLDSSRFAFLFASTDATDLEHINQFLWTARGERLRPEQVDRILAYWRQCLAWAQAQSVMPVKVMSTLSGLAAFLPDATGEHLSLLLAVAPHVHVHHHTHGFLEQLNRLVESSPAEVCTVLARFIETHEPSYDYKNKMQTLVRRLADLGFRADAIAFCNALRSMPGLRDLFMTLTADEPRDQA